MNRNRSNRTFLCVVGMALLLSACAKERPVKPVPQNGNRIEKSLLSGTWQYLNSVPEVKYHGHVQGADLDSGMHLDWGFDHIVQFVINENTLDIVSVDPIFHPRADAELNKILVTFEIKNVDVLRKKNQDDQDTNIEEQTETVNHWRQRKYIQVDLNKVKGDYFTEKDIESITPADRISYNPDKGTINLTRELVLKDGTFAKERYSFRRYQPSPTYEQRPYPKDLQERFGVFSTRTYAFDKYGKITDKTQNDFMRRWDTSDPSKPIVFYFSKGFPDYLKPLVQEGMSAWNTAMKEATGHDCIEKVRENTGEQELGDLGWNVVHYEPSFGGRLLGYGPSVADHRTGQVIQASVVLFGGNLKSQIHRERAFGAIFDPTPKGGTSGTSQTMEDANFAAKAFGMSDLSAMGAGPGLDRGLLKSLMEEMSPDKMLESVRKKIYNDNVRSMTTLSDSPLAQTLSQPIANMGDDDIEKTLFRPLFEHEAGHTLGLRHNFKSSADGNHFEKGSIYSSVMDYGFRAANEPAQPGQYDKAVIQYIYGKNDAASVKALLDENYYFCTDHQVLSSADAMCNQRDEGTNLLDVVTHFYNRYSMSYLFNNLRGDRVNFGKGDSHDYFERVFLSLLPIRLILDHANAITEAKEEGPDGYGTLWTLLKQRIEPDKKSNKKNIVPVKVIDGLDMEVQKGKPGETGSFGTKPRTVTRYIDTDKIEALYQDAVKAKRSAFASLTELIFDHRSIHGSADSRREDMIRRGVLLDKLLTLRLVGVRLSDPTGEGKETSPFLAADLAMATEQVIGSVISGTQTEMKPIPVKDAAGKPLVDPKSKKPVVRILEHAQLRGIDLNMRMLTLDTLTNDLGIAGLRSGLARKLLFVELVDVDVDALAKRLSLRPKIEAMEAQIKEGDFKRGTEPGKKYKGLDAVEKAIRTDDEKYSTLSTTLSSLFRTPVPPLNFAFAEGLKKIGNMRAALAQLKDEYKKAGGNEDVLNLEKIDTLREKIRDSLQEIRVADVEFSELDSLLDEVRDKDKKAQAEVQSKIDKLKKHLSSLFDELALAREARTKGVPYAYARDGKTTFFRAPLTLSDDGFNFRTISGRLIKDTINTLEDEDRALSVVVSSTKTQLLNSKLKEETEFLQKVQEKCQKLIPIVRSQVVSEKQFLRKLYDTYRAH